MGDRARAVFRSGVLEIGIPVPPRTAKKLHTVPREASRVDCQHGTCRAAHDRLRRRAEQGETQSVPPLGAHHDQIGTHRGRPGKVEEVEEVEEVEK